MSRDSGDFDIDDSSENVLSEWPRAADEPSGGDSEGSRASETWSIAAPAPAEETQLEADPTEPELDEPGLPDAEQEDEPEPEFPETDPELAAIAVEPSLEHAAGELEIPEGYAVLEGVPDGGRRAVGIVVARFNGSVTSQLLDRALAELETAGVRRDAITIMVVPGAFELPIAATALAKTRRFACIVALGCVIRGDTPHFDYVAGEAASGLQLAALETGVPVSFGVLTLERVEQAEPRIEKGAEAVRSALEMADVFSHLRAAASR
jgi:6,7-dimethyl-8-ribityllumazine synthase